MGVYTNHIVGVGHGSSPHRAPRRASPYAPLRLWASVPRHCLSRRRSCSPLLEQLHTVLEQPATLRAATLMMHLLYYHLTAPAASSSSTLGMGQGVWSEPLPVRLQTLSPSLAESRTARRIRDRPAAAGPSPEGPQ